MVAIPLLQCRQVDRTSNGSRTAFRGFGNASDRGRLGAMPQALPLVAQPDLPSQLDRDLASGPDGVRATAGGGKQAEPA